MIVIEMLTGFLLLFAAMTGLSLAMDRHYEQLTQQRDVPSRRSRQLRAGGTVLLLLSLAVCIQSWGGPIGLTLWCGFLTLTALAVACLLAYVPKLALALTLAAMPLGLLGLSLRLALG